METVSYTHLSCIGYVPDFFGVYDNLTVGEYMSFFAACYHICLLYTSRCV